MGVCGTGLWLIHGELDVPMDVKGVGIGLGKREAVEQGWQSCDHGDEGAVGAVSSGLRVLLEQVQGGAGGGEEVRAVPGEEMQSRAGEALATVLRRGRGRERGREKETKDGKRRDQRENVDGQARWTAVSQPAERRRLLPPPPLLRCHFAGQADTVHAVYPSIQRDISLFYNYNLACNACSSLSLPFFGIHLSQTALRRGSGELREQEERSPSLYALA